MTDKPAILHGNQNSMMKLTMYGRQCLRQSIGDLNIVHSVSTDCTVHLSPERSVHFFLQRAVLGSVDTVYNWYQNDMYPSSSRVICRTLRREHLPSVVLNFEDMHDFSNALNRFQIRSLLVPGYKTGHTCMFRLFNRNTGLSTRGYGLCASMLQFLHPQGPRW